MTTTAAPSIRRPLPLRSALSALLTAVDEQDARYADEEPIPHPSDAGPWPTKPRDPKHDTVDGRLRTAIQTPEQWETLNQTMALMDVVSLDEPMKGTGDGQEDLRYWDIHAAAQEDAEATYIRREENDMLAVKIDAALAKMTDREARIVRWKLMEGLTLEACAERLAEEEEGARLTRERVRQILNIAQRKCRTYLMEEGIGR